MKRLALMVLMGLAMAWPSPDLGNGWCGSDTDCLMVWGEDPEELDEVESVFDFSVRLVA